MTVGGEIGCDSEWWEGMTVGIDRVGYVIVH